jgi:hypothetical protein
LEKRQSLVPSPQRDQGLGAPEFCGNRKLKTGIGEQRQSVARLSGCDQSFRQLDARDAPFFVAQGFAQDLA